LCDYGLTNAKSLILLRVTGKNPTTQRCHVDQHMIISHDLRVQL